MMKWLSNNNFKTKLFLGGLGVIFVGLFLGIFLKFSFFELIARAAGTIVISINSPTNGASFQTNAVPVGIDIANAANMSDLTLNLNGASYKVYDNTLALMFNLDNVLSLGESLASTQVIDVSSYKTNGVCTNMGTACSWVAGKYGNALSFAGTTGNVIITPSNVLNNLYQHTVGFWMNPKDSNLTSTIFNKLGEGEGFRILRLSNGAIAYDLASGRGFGATESVSNQAVSANTWTHVVVTYDGSTQRMYINGVLQSNIINTTAFVSNSFSPVEIGYASCCGIVNGYYGLLDEIKVWNRSLSAVEVQQEYFSTLSKYSASNWSFDSSLRDLSNNTYNLSLTAVDNLGNTNTSDILTFIVGSGSSADTTAPAIPVGLSAVSLSSSEINLSWSAATDNIGVVGYRIYRNGVQINTSVAVSYRDTGLSANTNYSYTVAAYDAAGNISLLSSVVSATTTVVSINDFISPNVSVASPSNGAVVTNSMSLTAIATDNVGVAGVQFRVDGVNVGNEDTTSPYSISWASTSVANGSHSVTAVARDAAGNSTVSVPISITVTNTSSASFKNINHQYPRIGLLQWGGGNVDWFCKHDLVIVPQTETNKARQMQIQCPATYIIATNDWTQGGIFQPPGHADVLPDVWYQKEVAGTRVPTGIWGMMNFTNYCPKYTGYITSSALADFNMPTSIYINNKTYTEALADAYMDYMDWTVWDGINSDGTWPFPYNSMDIDLNLNKINDWNEFGCASPCTNNSAGFETAYLAIQKIWQAGNESLIQSLRDKMEQKLGGQKIITYWTISNSDPQHGALMAASLVNGVGWEMASYMPGTNWNNFIPNNSSFNNMSREPKINWVDSTVLGDTAHAPVGNPKNYYRFMRYMLTQTLRGDNYFMQEDGAYFYDRFGYNEHYWHNWYDEFDLNLGYPTGAAQQLTNGAWVRFFDNGVSITNPTTATQTVTDANLRTLLGYNGPYYRFKGNQDPVWNNGQQFTSIILTSTSAAGSVSPIGDGIILLKTPTAVVSDIVVDNSYAGTSPGSAMPTMVGFSWDQGASSNYNHSSYYVGARTDNDSIMRKQHYAPAGSGSATATFRPTINVPGQYRVYEWHGWYGANQTNTEATNTPVAITHSGGTANLTINQRTNFGQWNLVGTYNFDNTHAAVVINNNANGYVIADAFKFVYADSTINNISDTIVPTVSIITPLNNQTVAGSVTVVTAEAADNVGVVGVQFQLNGTNLGSELTSRPFSINWNTINSVNGSYSLVAVARDAAGNQTSSIPINIIVNNITTPILPTSDLESPTVSVMSPLANATVSATVTLSVTAADNIGVTGVQIKLDGTNIGDSLLVSPYIIVWDTTQTTNGSHTISAVASDAAGNKTNSTGLIVMVSNLPPTNISNGGGGGSGANTFTPPPATAKPATFTATPLNLIESSEGKTDPTVGVIAQERAVSSSIDRILANRLKGQILLQVESHGEAWYVNPKDNKRYYLADGPAAYQIMRKFSLGITNSNLTKIPIGVESRLQSVDTDKDGLDDKLESIIGTDIANPDTDNDGYSDGNEISNSYDPLAAGNKKLILDAKLTNRLKGQILLQVESHGEAWYVNPKDNKRYYLADGPAAYQIMRFKSLGITNKDLRKIEIGELNK